MARASTGARGSMGSRTTGECAGEEVVAMTASSERTVRGHIAGLKRERASEPSGGGRCACAAGGGVHVTDALVARWINWQKRSAENLIVKFLLGALGRVVRPLQRTAAPLASERARPPARAPAAAQPPPSHRPLRQTGHALSPSILSSFLLLTTFGYLIYQPPKRLPLKTLRSLRLLRPSDIPKNKKHNNHG